MTEKVQEGGLMRCCLKTLDEERTEAACAAKPATEGDRIKCRWCDSEMIFSGGTWMWLH
jgi:hypothetical protein